MIILSFSLTLSFLSVLVRELIFSRGRIDISLFFLLSLTGALLAYSIYVLVLLLLKIKGTGLRELFRLPFDTRLYSSVAQRTFAASVISSIISIGYGSFNLVLGIYHTSAWHSAISAYYLAQTMVYWLMLSSFKRHRDDKMRSYRDLLACGALLLILSLCLTLAVFQMISQDKYPVSSGALLYASSAFAIYKILSAVIKAKRHYRGYDAQLVGIAAIRLTSAAVSLLTLQASLLSYFYVFGAFASLLNGISGALSCVFSFVVSARTIYISLKILRSVS